MERREYRVTLLDRLGPDAGYFLNAVRWALPVSIILAIVAFFEIRQYGLFWALGGAILVFAGLMVFIAGGALAVAHGTAAAFMVFLAPRGASGVEDFSYEKSLVARGRTAEALAAYERRMAERPDHPAAWLGAAEICAKTDPRRACELFTAARGMRKTSAGQAIFATNRLVDLYLDGFGSPADAARELQHLIDRHPGTSAATHARTALDRLRADGLRG